MYFSDYNQFNIINRKISVIMITAGISQSQNQALPPPSDRTPTPTPNWGNINFNNIDTTYQYSSQQIAGITSSIVLVAQYPNGVSPNEIFKIYYKISTTPFTPNTLLPPEDNGLLYLENEGAFAVNKDQYVIFGLIFGNDWAGGTYDSVCTIINQSDSRTILDTFNIYIIDI